MTKPTDSKVPAAFQSMLAFLRYLFTGDAKWSSAPEMIGVLSACSLSATPMLSDPDLLALRDLVQAAADEHAGSASPDAPSAAGDPFAAIQKRHAEDSAMRGSRGDDGVPLAHSDRRWLIGEVERLRAIEQCGDIIGVLHRFKASVGAVGPMPTKQCQCVTVGPRDSAADHDDACPVNPGWTAPQPNASLHVGVDPSHEGDRTAAQVREPAFDRLAAAVGMLRRTRFTDDMAVVQAFDAFVAARAAEVEPATPAETLTFTRLKGETPEAFRARIALHLNGMGSARYVLPGQDGTREALGAIVRGVWIKWAKEQPSPKPSWLVPWEGLSEPDKEVDRRIGVALATVGQGFAGAIDAPVLSEEAAGRWAAVIGRRCSSLREEPLDVVAGELLAASRGEYPKT